jgi:serine/threonine-protein kinase
MEINRPASPPSPGATVGYGERSSTGPVNPALDATLASDPGGGTLAPPAPGLPTTQVTGVVARTTVLPRVTFTGPQPELVIDSKQRFEVLRQLGAGGAGEVVAALDHDIGRKVALKKIRAEVKSPVALLRFVEEIRTIGRLEHPNIIPIHDVGVDERGDYYFVMKYVDGETLESIIAKLRDGDPAYHREYTFEHRVQVFRGVLEAVAFAHANGIVHRDLKPANVMVGKYGEVLVMDWGIAKAIRDPGPGVDDALREPTAEADGDERSRFWRTQVGGLIGTPAYMSPEQARGEPVDERSDVYALSVMLHELLCLKHYLADKPTLAMVLQGVQDDKVPMTGTVSSPHQPPAPMDLSWYIRQGVQKDPARRYPSVTAMIDRLDRRAEGLIPIQCHITLMKRLNGMFARFTDRHPMLASLGLLGGVVALVAAVVLRFA